MPSIVFLALVSFAVCFALTPVVLRWSLRYGAVDQPDGDRKLHRLPIPRTGGIAIAIGCVVAFVAFFLTPSSDLVSIDLPAAVGITGAILVIFITGLVDDLIGLNAPVKFAAQIAAACTAYFAGVEVLAFAGISTLGWWSLPVTVIWLVVCSNAFNLIDGVDGLAAGVGLVAAVTMLFAALINGSLPLALATAPLVGALVAFLRYNFNPASIFLGDCGSLTIGFVLGCFGVIWSQKATTLFGITAPLMALAVPLVDTGLAVVRRFLRHQPLFRGDRNHIHHRLLDRGMSPRQVALALAGMTALTATFALIQTATRSAYSGVLIVVFGAGVWLAVRSLRYVEFTTARVLATSGVFRHVLDVHVYLKQIESRISGADTREELWQAVRDVAQRFGFVWVQLQMDGVTYEHGRWQAGGSQCRVRIPLPRDGHVEFMHPSELSVPRAIAVNALGEMLQVNLALGTPWHTSADKAFLPGDVVAVEDKEVDVGVR